MHRVLVFSSAYPRSRLPIRTSANRISTDFRTSPTRYASRIAISYRPLSFLLPPAPSISRFEQRAAFELASATIALRNKVFTRKKKERAERGKRRSRVVNTSDLTGRRNAGADRLAASGRAGLSVSASVLARVPSHRSFRFVPFRFVRFVRSFFAANSPQMTTNYAALDSHRNRWFAAANEINKMRPGKKTVAGIAGRPVFRARGASKIKKVHRPLIIRPFYRANDHGP